MGWFVKKFEKFRTLPPLHLFTHVLGKFVFGVGLGVLLVIYLPQLDWQLFGWLIIVLSIVIAIRSTRKILSKKEFFAWISILVLIIALLILLWR